MLKSNDATKAAVYELQQFTDHLQDADGVFLKFDYDLMRQTIRQMKVYGDRTVEVEFVSGQEVYVEV